MSRFFGRTLSGAAHWRDGYKRCEYRCMPLKLDELGELVRSVVRERQLDANVIAVTRSQGEGAYAEVIVDLLRPTVGEQRISLGLDRDASVDELRQQVATTLAET
jgi:hypothetical protein